MTAASGPYRILHLGLGNFHRAHQAVHTADAAGGSAGGDRPWEITGVAHSSRTVVDALHRQGMRYGVVTLGPRQTDVRTVDVVTDAFTAACEPGRVVAETARPDVRVVSLTVTEKGYDMRPGTRRLDLDAPGIRHDLTARVPRTTIGRLAAGLLRRSRAGAGPLTLLRSTPPTANGRTLQGLLRDFAAALPPRESTELAAFLDSCVTFPDTMVDRIVPATTDEHRRYAAEAGLEDAVPVPAEPFSQWVMRDDFAAGRPAWERAGAVLTDRVHDYETVKVRMLNGTHSLLAYLALLTGRPLIADAACDPAIAETAWRLGEEYLPTLDVPDGLDIAAYRSELFDRFTNRRLGHRAAQVGSDGSLKLAQRVPAAARWHLDRGHTPPVLALLVAAWLQCLARPGRLRHDRTGTPADPAAERLRELGARLPGSPQLARTCLRDEALLGETLAEHADFTELVGELLTVLEDSGTGTALEATREATGRHRPTPPSRPERSTATA